MAGGSGLSRPLQALEQVLIAPRNKLSRNAVNHFSCVVICNGHPPPGPLCHHCDAHAIPLLTASVNEVAVARALAQSLAEQPVAPPDEYPKIGTVVDVFGCGVLLSGPSGIGKSELALGLVDRGHALVVDDGPEFQVDNDNALLASCPSGFEGMIEVRGVGIADVRQLYGDRALTALTRLSLIIELGSAPEAPSGGGDRIAPATRTVFINTIELPLLKLVTSPGRNLPLVVEVAVKRQQLA